MARYTRRVGGIYINASAGEHIAAHALHAFCSTGPVRWFLQNAVIFFLLVFGMIALDGWLNFTGVLTLGWRVFWIFGLPAVLVITGNVLALALIIRNWLRR